MHFIIIHFIIVQVFSIENREASHDVIFVLSLPSGFNQQIH